MKLHSLFQEAVKAGFLTKAPDQSLYDHKPPQMPEDHYLKYISSLELRVQESIDLYKRVKKESPDLLRYGGLRIELENHKEDLLLAGWLRQITIRKEMTNSINEDGFAVIMQDALQELVLVIEDQKGRQHRLCQFAADHMHKSRNILLVGSLDHFVYDGPMGVYPRSDLKHLFAKIPSLAFAWPGSDPFHYERQAALSSALSGNPMSENDTPASNLHGKFLIPVNVAGVNSNKALCKAFNLDTDALIAQFRYGPTNGTIKRMIDEIAAKPECLNPTSFGELLKASFKEKGLTIHPALEKELIKITPPQLDDVKKNGVKPDFLSAIVSIVDYSKKSDQKPKPDFKPKLEQEKTNPAAARQKDYPQHDNTFTHHSAENDDGYKRAAEVFESMHQQVEPAQLCQQLISAFTRGGHIGLTAPERSGLEHMAAAMQYQPGNAKEGLHWFANTISLAAIRQAPKPISSGVSRSNDHTVAPGARPGYSR